MGAQGHQVQIRMTAAFESVVNRIPEKSLHLTDMRSGSTGPIIAEFLVMPSNGDHHFLAPRFSAEQIVERLRGAVAKNAADLCALPLAMKKLYLDATVKDFHGAALEGCTVEIKDLGFAKPILV